MIITVSGTKKAAKDGPTIAELIDGMELGGVSTFLSSGEQSDMSLFI